MRNRSARTVAMCKPKPFPRCANHARKALAKAHAEYAAATPETTVELEANLIARQHEYDLTPEARKELRALAADLDALKDPLKSADSVLLKQRANELETQYDELVEIAKKETVFTKKYADTDEQLKAFQEELHKTIEDLPNDENWKEYLNTISKFHRYSPTNQMMIMVQNPDASLVAGFNKWKDLERAVNKGEKGIRIFVPLMQTVTSKDTNGKPVLGADGKPEKRSFTKGFKMAAVFDVSQTDGKPIQTEFGTLTETPPDGFHDDLEAAVSDAGFTVSYAPLSGSRKGYTTADGSNQVVVDANLSPAERSAVLAHELGHIKAGHTERKGEYHQGEGGCRGEMEVEAESIAYSLCRANGMSTDLSQSSSAYIHGWARTNPEHVKKSAELVSKTVKGILDSSKWRNVKI